MLHERTLCHDLVEQEDHELCLYCTPFLISKQWVPAKFFLMQIADDLPTFNGGVQCFSDHVEDLVCELVQVSGKHLAFAFVPPVHVDPLDVFKAVAFHNQISSSRMISVAWSFL